MYTLLLAVLVIAAVAVVLVLCVFGPYLGIWVNARASNAEVALIQLPLMRIRLRQPATPRFVVSNLISLTQAGIEIDISDLEAHVLAGGNLAGVTEATIAADRADLGMDFRQLAAIDLAGRDVMDAVDTSVNPRTLECPPPGTNQIQGVARDGIRVEARVRITVRTNLNRLVGGATSQTVIARVGEGIVAAIGKTDSHKQILQEPEIISAYILQRGLDRGTAYEILSVDVYHVEIVDNIRARLQEIQAASDEKVAQARAEIRRAAAVAREREMHARVTEMTAQVTAAEAVVPTAMANAYSGGRIWRSPRPVGGGFQRRLWDCWEEI